MRLLRIAALIELVTVVILFANLATVHWPVVSSTVGPTHGCAYLFVVIAVLRENGAPVRTRLTAFIPGIGGLLALRQLNRQLDSELNPATQTWHTPS
jgi:hypothetical protein